VTSGSTGDTTRHVEETRRFQLRDVNVDAAFFLPFLRPGMTLLDVGCGPGSITAGLAGLIAPGRVIGADKDPARIETASRDAAADGVSYRVADVTALPFEDDHFDAVFANALIEHLPDPGAGVKELMRVLKPGGAVGVRCPDWSSALLHPDNDLMWASIALRNRWQQHRGDHPDAGRLLRGLLAEAGFVDINADATAQSHGTDDGVAEGVRYMHSILNDPELVALAREHGWANEVEMEEMRRSWVHWAAQPGAFSSFFWCHATGRKPGRV